MPYGPGTYGRKVGRPLKKKGKKTRGKRKEKNTNNRRKK
jgi:hypothetical protein